MRKIIYQTISSALLAIRDDNALPVINHVDLFNHQLDYIGEEQPFNTPAVLIEFEDIAWSHMPHGVREATAGVRLHIVTDSRVGRWADAMEVQDLLDIVNAGLHGLSYSDDDGNAMDALTLVSSSTDSNFDELRDNVESYSAHITDASAHSCRNRHAVNALNIAVGGVAVEGARFDQQWLDMVQAVNTLANTSLQPTATAGQLEQALGSVVVLNPDNADWQHLVDAVNQVAGTELRYTDTLASLRTAVLQAGSAMSTLRQTITEREATITQLNDTIADMNRPTWRTPSVVEFAGILNQRLASTVNGTANARYALATVYGVTGLILFPDIYTHPDGVPQPASLNTYNAAFTSNVYTAAEWVLMEAAGAVFLYFAKNYAYWCCNQFSGTEAYNLKYANSGYLDTSSRNSKTTFSYAVRLVKYCSADTPGAFSNGSGRHVRFSPGALVKTGSVFSFADSQLAQGSTFLWGSSGWNGLPARNLVTSLTGGYANGDWGVYNNDSLPE